MLDDEMLPHELASEKPLLTFAAFDLNTGNGNGNQLGLDSIYRRGVFRDPFVWNRNYIQLELNACVHQSQF